MKKHACYGLLVATATALASEFAVAQEPPDAVRELAGTIVNREGQPVAGATLFTHAIGKLERTFFETKSNAKGEFVITIPPDWPGDANMYTWILADGYAVKIVRPGVVLGTYPKTADDASRGQSITGSAAVVGSSPNAGSGQRTVTIRLDRPDPAVYQVQGPDGKPLAGASVGLVSMNAPLREFAIDKPSGYSMYVAPELKERFTRTTDAQGRVTLDFVTRSLVHGVAVSTPEYGEQQISFSSRPSDTLKLQPVGELTVKVEGEAAADFAGTQLSIDTGNLGTSTSKQNVTLDETGQAHLAKVMVGRVRCTLPNKEVNGRFLVAAGDVEIKAGGNHVFRLKPQQSVEVAGSVLTKDTQEPIAGVKVLLYAGGQHFFSTSAETDGDGKFALRAAPGDYQLSCVLEGAGAAIRDRYYFESSFTPLRQPPVRIKAGEAKHVVPPILATPKSRVRGQVRNLDSQPIVNVTVMLIPSRGTTPILTAETDGSGRFEAQAKDADIRNRTNRWAVVEKDHSTAGYREVMALYARDDDPKSLVLVQAE